MDSCGTAGNVTGDGAIALIMDKTASRMKGAVPEVPAEVAEDVTMDQKYAK
jgi:Na+/H+-dicarboxylate symporter